jgi:hypothetical protein
MSLILRQSCAPLSNSRSFPFLSFSQPVRFGEPEFEHAENANTPTKRRRHSSELATLYSGNQGSGVPFGSSAQIALPALQSASSSRYQMAPHNVGKEEGPYALSDTRSSYLAPDVPFASMQMLTNQEAANRLSGRRSFGARGQDSTTAYAIPQLLDTSSIPANIMGETPSSMQAASAAAMSAPTTRSTPASGAAQARMFDNRIFDSHPLHNDTRGMHDDTRDVSHTCRDSRAEQLNVIV